MFNMYLSKKWFLPLVVNLFFAFVLLVCAPFEVYMANLEDLRFPLSAFWWINLLIAILWTAGITLLCTVIDERVSSVILSVIFALTLCMFVQGIFLNPNLGELSGEEVEWGRYSSKAFKGMIIWVLIFAGTLYGCLRYKVIWKQVVAKAALLVIVIQAVYLVFTFMTTDLSSKSITRDFLNNQALNLSKDENIICIVLDYFDNSYREQLLEDDPSFFDGMDGFVCYTNSVASYPRTYPSVLHMLTTEECAYEVGKNVWTKRAFENGKGIAELKDSGFDVRLFPDKETLGISDTYSGDIKTADNWGSLELHYHYGKLESSLFSIVLFRDLPVYLKPCLWRAATTAGSGVVDAASNIYSGDDDFYTDLKTNRLSAGMDKKVFRYYHLIGCHPPYTFNEKMERVSEDQTDLIRQCKGEFQIVFEYLDQLKDLGIYDNSLIIVTADHGVVSHDGYLTEPRTPIMFVKEKDRSASESYSISTAPVGHEDIWPTIRAEYLSGHENDEEFSDVPVDSDRKRYFHATHVDDSGVEKELVTYEIIGDANDINNWNIVSKGEIKHPSYHDPDKDGE